MVKRQSKAAFFAVCVDNSEYPAALELHKIYRVLEVKEAEKTEDFRVVDESGQDYLYPAEYFILMEVPQEVRQSLLQAS